MNLTPFGSLYLLGSVPLFLSQGAAATLTSLCGSGARSLGGGSYVAEVQAATLTGAQDIMLRRSKTGRIHDLAWNTFFKVVEACVAAAGGDSLRGTDEWVVYDALLCTAHTLGERWPSDLRNAINYGPRFGYTMVRRSDSVFRVDLQWDCANDCMARASRIRSNYNGLQARPLFDQLGVAERILADEVCVMFELLRALYEEVAARRRIDERWRRARRTFTRAWLAMRPGAEELWPAG